MASKTIEIVLLILNKKHNNLEGLERAVSLKAQLNNGLSLSLKEAFPNINNQSLLMDSQERASLLNHSLGDKKIKQLSSAENTHTLHAAGSEGESLVYQNIMPE